MKTLRETCRNIIHSPNSASAEQYSYRDRITRAGQRVAHEEYNPCSTHCHAECTDIQLYHTPYDKRENKERTQ